MEETKYRHATFAQVVAIAEHLKAISYDAEQGAFKDGWSDEKVAKAVANGAALTRHSVAHVRHELFGRMKKSGNFVNQYTLTSRIDDIERRLGVIEEALR